MLTPMGKETSPELRADKENIPSFIGRITQLEGIGMQQSVIYLTKSSFGSSVTSYSLTFILIQTQEKKMLLGNAFHPDTRGAGGSSLASEMVV